MTCFHHAILNRNADLSPSCYTEQEYWPVFIMLYWTGILTCLHHAILNKNADLFSSYYTEQECWPVVIILSYYTEKEYWPVFIILHWTGMLTCLHHAILNRNADLSSSCYTEQEYWPVVIILYWIGMRTSLTSSWDSYQIRKVAVRACAGNAGNAFTAIVG